MKKKTSLYDDEIDLIELLKIIWNSKKKILLITTISFLIGFAYSYKVPNTYLISLDITKNDESAFKQFNFINQLIFTNQKNETNQIVLEKFIKELEDYDEFLLSLRNTKKVRENIFNLSTKDQKKELMKYVDFLKIKIKKGSDLKLNFKWENKDEADDVLQNTINLTLKNIEKLIYKELDRNLEEKKKLALQNDLMKLDYLKEQRWIAKELNISDPPYGYTGEPYYLRGYVAIDKEIEIIDKRQYQKFDLIKQEINSLKKESIDWIKYNIFSTKVKSLKNTKLILAISIIIGLIVGTSYVLISNAFNLKLPRKITN